MATVTVTDASFEADVLKAPGPVLVDFWAEWCVPCKQIGPVLEEIAAEFAGKITVAKVNVDENKRTPDQYKVRGIPMLLIFKGGQAVSQKLGVMPKSKLVEWVKSNL